MHEAVRPDDLLPGDQSHAEINGVSVRKGTIGAFLANVQTLDHLRPGTAERSEVEAELRATVPLLRSIGLLDVFRFRDAALAELLGIEG